MFGNLIESGSHARDFRRKGSFFLATFVFYLVLLAAAGVASIYAYNTHLENQQDEVDLMLRFPPSLARMEPETPKAPKPSGGGQMQRLTTGPEVSHITPYRNDRIASPTTKEVKAGVPVTILSRTFDAEPGGLMVGASGSFISSDGGNSSGRHVVRMSEDSGPPPIAKATPIPQPTTKLKTLAVSRILNGSAISKPAPPYPQIAKISRVAGVVAVQILIDEQGRVVSAQPTSGHPLLRQAATQAAYQARFSPTYLGEQPVKVSGVITYNFVLQ